jgi:hypothetical protein
MEWQRHESWKLVGTSTSGKQETERPANKYSSSSSSSLLRRLLLLPLLNNNSAAHRTFVIKKIFNFRFSATSLVCLLCVFGSLCLSVYFVCASERAREAITPPECCHKREMCTRNEHTRERERERAEKTKERKRRQKKLQKENNLMKCAAQ